MKNDTFLRALARQPTDYTPVWLMRQAGRYLPEYNATRKRAGSFLALAKTPALAVEVTLQPLDRFPLDAAIIFSDILTVPDAMGLGLGFTDGEGPHLARPVRDEATVARLAVPDMGELRYVMDALRECRKALDGRVPLIGFSGSPYTLACYMIQGEGSDDWREVRAMREKRPDLLHRVLEVNARAVAAYLDAQIEAGAQAVMVFDTWGGTLGDAYDEFSLAYSRKVFSGLKNKSIPSILFSKGAGAWLEKMAASGCTAVGIDAMTDPRAARKRIGARVALQGNLDPDALRASPAQVRASVRAVLDSFGPEPGHVFNLGHGVHRETAVEAVEALVDEVRTYSRALRKSALRP